MPTPHWRLHKQQTYPEFPADQPNPDLDGDVEILEFIEEVDAHGTTTTSNKGRRKRPVSGRKNPATCPRNLAERNEEKNQAKPPS